MDDLMAVLLVLMKVDLKVEHLDISQVVKLVATMGGLMAALLVLMKVDSKDEKSDI